MDVSQHLGTEWAGVAPSYPHGQLHGASLLARLSQLSSPLSSLHRVAMTPPFLFPLGPVGLWALTSD